MAQLANDNGQGYRPSPLPEPQQNYGDVEEVDVTYIEDDASEQFGSQPQPQPQPQPRHQSQPQNAAPPQQQPQIIYVEKENSTPPLTDNVLGLVGFILAIVSVVLPIPVLPWITLIGGFVCSILGMQKEPKALALAGVIICGIDIGIMLLTLIACGALFGAINAAVH